MDVSLKYKFVRLMQNVMNKDAIAGRVPDYNAVTFADINYFGEKPSKKPCYRYHLLDVYAPEDYVKGTDKKYPTIVEVHGGAYVSCYKEINRQHGQWFASKGFLVVNISYTLVPEATIAEEMQEIAKAFRWIEENADEYGFDLDRQYITGDSSGGHLVLLYAALQNRKDLQEYCGVEPMKHHLKAVAATCPVGSFKNTDYVSLLLNKILLGSNFKRRNDCDLLTYKNFIDESMLPAMIVTTNWDIGIHTCTKSIHKHMKKNIDHVYKSYKKRENNLAHVFNVLNPDWTESIEANTDIISFFNEH